MNRLFEKSNRLKVKICGVASIEDIKICLKFKVDAIGLLVKSTKLTINTEVLLEAEAKELISQMTNELKSVLLIKFANIDYIVDMIRNTKPDIIQLQKEAVYIDIAKKLRTLFPNLEIIKTFNVNEDTDIKSIYNEIDKYIPYIDAVSLDSSKGGSGKKHNWNISSAISKYTKTKGLSFVLAGGINADNIVDAYRIVRPDMIDIMSGARIDNRLDKKDPEKIKKIMSAVKGVNDSYEFQ